MFPWGDGCATARVTIGCGASVSGSASVRGVKTLAEDKIYKAEYVGSGTFLISKPKRKKSKQRQSNLKNVSRGSRK
jgi:hypothetical protein